MINSGYTRNKWNKCLNINQASIKYVVLAELRLLLIYTNFMFEFQTIYLFDVHSSILKKIMVGKIVC